VKKLDIQQMYNNSAMLHDAFRSKANEVSETSDKQMFDQLANDQKAIADRLKQRMGGEDTTTFAQKSGMQTPTQESPDTPHQS
jgi:hypothetical protein